MKEGTNAIHSYLESSLFFGGFHLKKKSLVCGLQRSEGVLRFIIVPQSKVIVVEEPLWNPRNSSVRIHIVSKLGFTRSFSCVALVRLCSLVSARHTRETARSFLCAHRLKEGDLLTTMAVVDSEPSVMQVNNKSRLQGTNKYLRFTRLLNLCH